MYMSWPPNCVSKFKKIDLEPFLGHRKFFRKSHPAERKGASTSALGPQGRELSGNCSEGYEDKGASAKPPRGYACNIPAQEAPGSQNHRKGKGTRESRQNPFKGTCLKNVPFGTLLNPEKV